MKKIVECVPNFSEGRDQRIIDEIVDSIEKCSYVNLLNVDAGASTNRTVITFVGESSYMVEASFQAIRTASSLIDMRTHKGAHPRIGAVDVCPFIPLQNCSMQECVLLAEELGERVGKELGIPVYLYAEAARQENRVSLAAIRKGQYEGLKERIENGNFTPDFGPARFNLISGATAIGARSLLIAYNINLNSSSEEIATKIARSIRESGYLKRNTDGQIIKNTDGTLLHIPGALKGVKAIGWYLDEYKKAQVSTNLVDLDIASLHQVFDEVKRQAKINEVDVTGSEIIGMVPLKAMLEAGKHYRSQQTNSSSNYSENELIEIAMAALNLNDIKQFLPQEKILECKMKEQSTF